MIKALIVDDDVKARNILRHYVENFIPEITDVWQAESAGSAAAILQHYQPDIVFWM